MLTAIIIRGYIISENAEGNLPESIMEVNIQVTVLDAMNITLPEGMTIGEFDVYLEQGNLMGVETLENHAVFTTEFEKINSEIPGVIAEYSRDHGEQPDVWHAF